MVLSLVQRNTILKPLTLIAGLTRNLPNGRVWPVRTGDGGCSSAMRVKGFSVVSFGIKHNNFLPLHPKSDYYGRKIIRF